MLIRSAQQAYPGNELINSAIGFNAGMVFRKPFASNDGGLSPVSGFGIYLHLQ
jgi:hypothetical protein